MLMSRIYDSPDESEMPPYQRTTSGIISTLIGSSLPSAATGIVLGPLGPFVFALKQSAITYGRTFDAAMVRDKGTHPGWTEEKCQLVASQAATDASKVPGIVAFVLAS